MSQLKVPLVIVTVSAAVFVFYWFLVGLYSFLVVPQDDCEMTYMFEIPKYIPIAVDADTKYSKYKLYAYGEGHYARMLKHGHFHGIPVLFVPGNAGCFKQVRSFASMAYRMHQDLHKAHHFNYFTVDYNEEFSGLYGGVLYTQSEFLRLAIRTIQNLYQDHTKVILMGHSMGGLVAKSIFLDATFDYNSVDIILTLSTPHCKPAFNFDWDIHTFYRDWFHYETTKPAVYQDKMFVSVSSGVRDRMIQAHQTTISNTGAINVVSTHIPNVHLSVDHLQAVWCRQLVKVMCLNMFDLIDPATLQITSDISVVKNITQRNLLGVHSKPAIVRNAAFDGNVVNVKERLFRHSVSSRDGPMKYIITVKPNTTLDIVVHNPPLASWLHYCTVECYDITGHVTQYPGYFYHFIGDSNKEGRYVIYLNPGRASVDSRSVRSSVFMQQHSSGERDTDISSYESRTIPVSESVSHSLTLSCLSSSDYWLSLHVTVTRLQCSHLQSPLKFPLGRFQFGYEDTFASSVEGVLNLPAQLLTVTQQDDTSFGNSPKVVLLLDPSCSYSIQIEADGMGTSANLIRYNYYILGGLLLYVTLSITIIMLRDNEQHTIFYLFVNDMNIRYTCILILLAKLLVWLLPTSAGFLGIDWMSIKPEIVLIALLTTYVLAFISTVFLRVLISAATRLVKALKLTSSTLPLYFTVKVQLVLCLVGALTSGSLIATVNFILYLVFLSTRHSPPPTPMLLLHSYGVLLQVPTLISWFKNVTVMKIWLEHDHITLISMVISSFSYVVMATHGTRRGNHLPKLCAYLHVLKYLTLTFVLTRTYAVPCVIYGAVAGMGLYFITAEGKTKVS